MPRCANRLFARQVGGEGADEESLIVSYLKQHGIINNTVCRQLLNVDRNRSSYVLRKFEREELLTSEGQGRWVQYRLSGA